MSELLLSYYGQLVPAYMFRYGGLKISLFDLVISLDLQSFYSQGHGIHLSAAMFKVHY